MFLGLVCFGIIVVAQYFAYLDPDRSLFLALFDDPAPRFSFYPWLVETARQFRAGYFPLWCAEEGLGFPLLANYQSSPLNPFNLAFAVWPSLKFLDFMLVLKLFLLGAFTYFFALEIGLSPISGLLSAIVIAFSGYVSKNINEVDLNTELWLPAALILAEKILKSGARLLWFLLLSLVSCLALIGGNPEAAFYFLLFITLYFLLRGGWAGRRQSLVIILSFLFALLLSSAQLLSFIEYLGFGWTIHDPNLHTIARAPARWAFSLFFPWLFGPNRTGPAQLFFMSYIGLIPVMLALFSFSAPQKRHCYFFWTFALVFLAVAYSLPPVHFLTRLPVFNRIASVKFAWFGVCFSVAMLAGMGLENYFQGRLQSRRIGLALAAASGLAVLALALAFNYPPSGLLRHLQRKAWMLPLLLYIIAALVVLYGVFAKERKFAATLLVFLALVNLLHLYPGWKPETRIDPGRWRFEKPIPPSFLKPVQSDPSRPRLTGLDQAFHQNLNLIYGVSDLRVFEGIYPRRYVEAMGRIEEFQMSEAVAAFFEHGWSFDVSRQNLGKPLVSMMAVKYLLSPEDYSIPGWRKVMRAEGLTIFENQDAWPRVWLKQRDGPVDFSAARILREQPGVMDIVARREKSDLVISSQYAPGWRAYDVDAKKEIRILPEYGLFQKLDLEATVPPARGLVSIRLKYQPWGFRVGIFSTLAAFAALAAGFVLPARKRLNRLQKKL